MNNQVWDIALWLFFFFFKKKKEIIKRASQGYFHIFKYVQVKYPCQDGSKTKYS